MIGRLVAAAVLAAAASGAAGAQDAVVLENAWMRPAPKGQAQAAVYVDIRVARPLRLVGAASAAAARAELVLVDPPDPDPATHRVVGELPVPGGGLRLALGGSHVRLVDVARDLPPGERVPLELVFADATGKRTRATTEVLVRGLMLRPAPPAPR